MRRLLVLILLLIPALCFGGPSAGFLGVDGNGKLPVATYGSVDGTTASSVRLDASTEAAIIIEYEHHEVHDGSMFTAQYGNDVTNIGEMTCIGFNVLATTKWPHMVIHGSSSAVAVFSLYENTSIDVNEGTDLTIWNRNRNSATVSTLLSIESPAVAGNLTSYNEAQAVGANITITTELHREQIGSAGNVQSASGGQTRGQAEWVLDQGGQYAVCITSETADDSHHNLILDWYEHTDRN